MTYPGHGKLSGDRLLTALKNQEQTTMAKLPKLDWTPVDVSKSSRPIQTAFAAYEKAREDLLAATTKALASRKEIPAGHTVKVGLMFNRLSYAIVPESGSTGAKSVTL